MVYKGYKPNQQFSCHKNPSCPAYVGHGNDECLCSIDGYCRQVFDCEDCMVKSECQEVLANTILRLKYLLKGGDYCDS